MKFIYNGLNKKNISENLQSNVVKVKRTSRKTSLTPIHSRSISLSQRNQQNSL